jgi:hypothetical protein
MPSYKPVEIMGEHALGYMYPKTEGELDGRLEIPA